MVPETDLAFGIRVDDCIWSTENQFSTKLVQVHDVMLLGGQKRWCALGRADQESGPASTNRHLSSTNQFAIFAAWMMKPIAMPPKLSDSGTRMTWRTASKPPIGP